ncbi:hypothetical protein NAEGRDRAFT_77701 [Naegleria gruberi]|uniref:Uncharacterized protein n=1 Tax=Naegleria gruberi TaxID=5762 RepID=D2UXQ8_NAEGR|nr:uncharacterized protein NAEGRDRAFT_77701 [Naegleria gruberi]EFC50672.1 hypothetical protein NAEGRDRAFT_77701 [Naegleria gruberi]|eukprot:XP_002683416.1 hypothetical protein NAEGRDRAFT_77701 [Naegleria gruberi strain NEG-M]
MKRLTFGIVCCLLVSSLVMVVSGGIQTCSNLNAVAEDVQERDYIQYIVDQQPINQYFTTFVSRAQKVANYDTMTFSNATSSVFLTLLQSDSVTKKIANQTLFPFPEVTYIGISNPISTFYSLSVPTDYKYKSDIETMAFRPSVQTVKIDTNKVLSNSENIFVGDEIKYQKINHTAFISVVPFISGNAFGFGILDANSTSIPTINYNDTLGAFTYVFPSEFIKNEPIYDVNGTVIGVQTPSVDIDSIPSLEDSTSLQKVINVRISNLVVENPDEVGSKLTFDCTLSLLNQGSVKLIGFSVSTTTPVSGISPKATLTQKFAKVIVPRVESTNSLPLGAKMIIDGSVAYFLVSLSREQQKGFEAFHQTTLDFEQSQAITPFLIIVQISTGQVVKSINLGKNLIKTSVNYATDFDVRGENIVVVGNTEDITYESTIEQYKNVIPFYTFVSKGVVAQSGYFSDMFIKRDMVFITQNESQLRFIANAVSFSIDQSTNKFTVGGYVTDFNQPWLTNGRLVLSQVNATEITNLYKMQVAYENSNQVKVLRRAVVDETFGKKNSGNVEILNAALSMHGPTTPPPKVVTDDKFRNVATGFWQIDCEPINEQLAIILTDVFYAVFALIAFIMVVIILTFSSYGIYLCIRDYKRDSEESQRLIH